MTPTGASTVASRRRAVADIAVVFAASAGAYAAELAVAGHLPWGDEARGVVAVLVGAIAAIWLTLGRGRSFADLGLRRPGRWSTVPLWAIGIFAVYVVVQGTVPLLMAPFFELPAPDMSRYDAIRGNLPAALAMMLVLPLTASIPEEIVYRGFLIERLTCIFSDGRGAPVLAVFTQAIIFGAVHFQWGLGGIVVASIMGAVWGIAFLLCGRNLWIVIIAHSLGHIAMVTQLYLTPPAA